MFVACNRPKTCWLVLWVMVLLVGSEHSFAQAAEESAPVALKDFLILPKVGVYGRAPLHIDAIDDAIARGDWRMPLKGHAVKTPNGRTVQWKSATADEAGNLSTKRVVGGYVATQFHAPVEEIMLLEATGHAVVYVNGEPHAGDPYALGGYPIPVKMRKGKNTFVFHVAQPKVEAQLLKPASETLLLADRATLPSAVRSEKGKLWGSLPVVNTSETPLDGATLVAKVGNNAPVETPLAWLDAVSSRNVPFEFTVPKDAETPQVEIRVVRGDETLAEVTLSLVVVDASNPQVRTFRSRIDRSVQSYVVLPATNSDDGQPRGAILALHGAGESAGDFAAHYKPKPWAHFIVPTGRGSYGFDWEDWSRTDALEALDDASKHYAIDKQRIYVTGHAAGAHGALVLATTLPDRFAAVGTSAAWASLRTYGGGMPSLRSPTAMQKMLARSATGSDTIRLLGNLQTAGVYSLHGAADDRVPAEQSRLVLAELSRSHDDFAFHEEPGAGHWWGDETVDWPAMMKFFEARRRSDTPPSHVSFFTADLGVAASSHWVTIAGQQHPFAMSHVEIDRRDAPLSIVGSTENVTRMSIGKSAVPEGRPFIVRLDGQPPMRFRGMPASGKVWMEKQGGRWRRVLGPKTNDKGPARYGGFKAVFDHDCLLVYGTQGSDEENAWSRAKARFDAETFAYRGNGALDVIPDTRFDVGEDQDRNVVLYGNYNTNSACPALLSTSPVRMFGNRIEIGERPEVGESLGFLLVRPRTGSTTALVGVVGGTGLQGMKLTNRLRYFVSGVAYPDLIVFGPRTLQVGDRDVRAAGFFSESWQTRDADIVWRDLAL